jgi:radical SAM superfamily enzyme YgiQ (UPF0313 family)
MLFVNPDSRANRDIPNIGLGLAATHYGAKVIDLNTIPEPAERYLEHETDLLGISVQSRTHNEAEKIKDLYKSRYPDAKTASVTGFIDVQCCYPYITLGDNLDPGIPFGDEMPLPDYDLFDSIDRFKEYWSKGLWRYAIITSLGCPFSCTYCSASRRKVTTRSVEHCTEELKAAKEKWGIVKFIILDDCFNANRERVLKFCELVRPLNLKWGCANGLRADRFDEDVARALFSSGCDFISLGIESADEDVLRGIKKGETIEQIASAVRIAGRYFDDVNGYFIIGLPGSSYQKDLGSLRWALRHGINAHFSYYVPFDRQMYYDAIFFGEGAKPISDEYQKELQKKIFAMTACMRSDYGGSYLKRTLGRLSLTMRFAPGSLPKLLWRKLRSGLHG